MKRPLFAAAAMLLATTAQAADVWENVEQNSMCRMQTGSAATGAIAITFVKGQNLHLQLFKDKHAFPTKRMCGLRDCPFITMTKVNFAYADGHNSWVSGWAEANFNIVLGQGWLEMPILQSNVVSILTGLDDAKQISFEFADGSPSWSASVPGVEVTDKFVDCIMRFGGIAKTDIDRFAERHRAD
ncbi:hypothetical protein [Bradyrhizobium sp. BR 1432]|uniref:hypothetical protein n=1 Tax=Bradyrhizobium sp. BR 1432 TaxID=3447966 RepID=UPI003EE7710B